ncbi:uroporphyrinogen decarboxylase family protein [Marispirochaeta aestuarii]|uniref:uroporphyrinogen decarboxylase family protein n=1 Tax=Marispirochaeta aestuarii TaxID=1963862 RepID=UPI002ABD8AF3|nr:uroporphyrinogen decarboxylase family protein [Marispirochaeta aestuarii]
MLPEQWNTLERLVQGKEKNVNAALIVDSPWIPPFLNISTAEYLKNPELHFRSNMEIIRKYPEIIFFPGFWVEMGMAAEPSGYGTPVEYYDNQPPTIKHIIEDISEVDRLKPPNPARDGLMPDILKRYRELLPLVRAEGMEINVIAARGPMTLASHLMGVTNFLIGLKTEPELTHRLLKMTTKTVIQWLEAQAEVLPEVQGIFVLDDIMGFLCEEDYLEFAHDYFREIFALPAKLKVLHNDTPNPVSFRFLTDLGIDMFNFSHQVPIPDLRRLVGDRIVLMGNISPLDIMVKGSEEEVYEAAVSCIKQNGGNPRFLLSAGGGVSMGTPESTLGGIIRAISDANSGKIQLR